MIEPAQSATTADVARHYDQLDRFYRAIWGEHVHHGLWLTGRETSDEARRLLLDIAEAKLRIEPGMSVCDVGCGYGRSALIIARERRVNVTALTISPAQHRHAASVVQPADAVTFLLEDWLRNDRPPSHYDVLLAIESTEHMSDKSRAFAEAARVLKPGGRMVVCAWLAAEELTPWARHHLNEAICREARMPGMGTETEYRHWMMDAGFHVDAADEFTAQVARTWPDLGLRFCSAALRHPRALSRALDPRTSNGVFALTMLRIWIAYRIGAMRYVIFSATKHTDR